jgi:hypothetical protein
MPFHENWELGEEDLEWGGFMVYENVNGLIYVKVRLSL